MRSDRKEKEKKKKREREEELNRLQRTPIFMEGQGLSGSPSEENQKKTRAQVKRT
jgi:hypothetical protein